jgi:hypothetical protein
VLSAGRPVLRPASTAPLRVRGDGFRPRESVRVTVAATGGEPVTRRVRASGHGRFTVALPRIDAAGGVEGVAAGSRGSHASFQLSSGLGP